MKNGSFIVVAAVLSLPLLGCNPTDAPRPKGQAVVRVNGDEITMHQINYALVRLPKDQERDPHKIADQYVEQQLLLQRAKDGKLDRNSLDLLGRMGGIQYTRTKDRVELPRPKV